MEVGGQSYLTPQEAAQFLRVTRRTIYAWLRAKKLRAVKVGGQWRILETVLNTVVHNGTE